MIGLKSGVTVPRFVYVTGKVCYYIRKIAAEGRKFFRISHLKCDKNIFENVKNALKFHIYNLKQFECPLKLDFMFKYSLNLKSEIFEKLTQYA